MWEEVDLRVEKSGSGSENRVKNRGDENVPLLEKSSSTSRRSEEEEEEMELPFKAYSKTVSPISNKSEHLPHPDP